MSFIEFFSQLIVPSEYPLWIYWVTVFAVIIITQVIKLPIKHIVNKKVSNEGVKVKIGILYMIIPILIGILASYLYTFLGYSFSIDAGLRWGTTSQVLYVFGDKLFNRIKNGEKITQSTIEEDAKSSIEEGKTAEQAFNELVSKINKDADK